MFFSFQSFFHPLKWFPILPHTNFMCESHKNISRDLSLFLTLFNFQKSIKENVNHPHVYNLLCKNEQLCTISALVTHDTACLQRHFSMLYLRWCSCLSLCAQKKLIFMGRDFGTFYQSQYHGNHSLVKFQLWESQGLYMESQLFVMLEKI